MALACFVIYSFNTFLPGPHVHKYVVTASCCGPTDHIHMHTLIWVSAMYFHLGKIWATLTNRVFIYLVCIHIYLYKSSISESSDKHHFR